MALYPFEVFPLLKPHHPQALEIYQPALATLSPSHLTAHLPLSAPLSLCTPRYLYLGKLWPGCMMPAQGWTYLYGRICDGGTSLSTLPNSPHYSLFPSSIIFSPFSATFFPSQAFTNLYFICCQSSATSIIYFHLYSIFPHNEDQRNLHYSLLLLFSHTKTT